MIDCGGTANSDNASMKPRSSLVIDRLTKVYGT